MQAISILSKRTLKAGGNHSREEHYTNSHLIYKTTFHRQQLSPLGPCGPAQTAPSQIPHSRS